MSRDFSPRPGRRAVPRQVLAQAAMETRLLLRNGEQLLLAVVIPVLVLVGGGAAAPTGSTSTSPTAPVDVFTPGVLALAVMSTSFTSLAIATGFERRYGVIKRLGASPLPRSGLLAGKVGALLVVEVLQVLVVGVVGFALGWRPGPRRSAAAAAGGAARHRRVRLPRPVSPACSVPRPRSPPRTWSTCCCWPAARSCCPARRTARFGHVAPLAAVRRTRRGACARRCCDGGVAWARLARPARSGASSAPPLTARTFRWE